MKKLLLTLTATLVCAGAFGQGKLAFVNNSDNLIYFTTDTSKLVAADRTTTVDDGLGFGAFPIAGSSLYTGLTYNETPGTILSLAGSPAFIAALYGGTSPSLLGLLTTTTIDDLYHDGNPGGIVSVNTLLQGFPGATPAWFQVQVYDSRADASSPVINGVGGGAANAWAQTNLYAGVSQLFQATPTSAIYAPIWAPWPPINSTWAPGIFPVADLQPLDAGYLGGIEVYANTGPPPPEPQITSQPSNTTNHWGERATFTVSATGAPPLWYQWQANGTNLSDSPHIAGSATNLLTLNAVTLADAGGYRVIITNDVGSVTSRVAMLTLTGGLSIIQQPVSQVGYLGKIATFHVTATGQPLPSYQWQKEDAPIPGATDESLVFTNLQATNAGRYRVVVSNPFGTITSSNAFLTVSPAGVTLVLYSGITIEGAVGQTYGIQCSTNLDDTNGWWGLTNLTLQAPTELWLDLKPAAQQQRYYLVVPRAISIP
jgi:hypothetical protein